MTVLNLHRERSTQFAVRVVYVVALVAMVYSAGVPILAWMRGSARDLADYGLNYHFSVEVLRDGVYPKNLTYPLPGLLLRAAFGSIGLLPSVLLWALLSIAAAYVCCWLCNELLGVKGALSRAGAAAMALLWVKYYVEWDLRALNCNLIYLALVLGAAYCFQKSRDWQGGLLLAASVALKLYSILFLPYLVYRRRFRQAGWLVVGMFLWFAVLPVLTVGPTSTIALNLDWVRRLMDVGDPHVPLTFPAYIVASHRLLHFLLSSSSLPNAAGWLDLEFATVERIAFAWKVFWLILVGGYFWTRRRTPTDGESLLSDTAVLMLFPLPISPLLQPHHCVVLLAAGFVLANDVLAGKQRPKFSLVILLIGGLILELGPGAEYRGISVLVQMVLALGGLIALRYPPPSKAATPVVPMDMPRAAA